MSQKQKASPSTTGSRCPHQRRHARGRGTADRRRHRAGRGDGAGAHRVSQQPRRSCCSVRRVPARRSSLARSTSTRRSGTARSAASTVARFLLSSSTRNSSATSRAPSPVRSPGAKAGSSRPTAARCSSMKSASSPRPRKSACCAWSRSPSWFASAENGRSK